ncbi:MAG: type II toxin-antitoxin system death-on-curing family toxin [Magnetococcales bacterium]|nr:type II toxin-antitoxin system death-on-curing family toxin [Magnetococcales bacterium]
MTPDFFSVEDIQAIHGFLVDFFQKSADPIAPSGVKNQGLLESAVSRPFHSVDGQDAYPTEFDKAAALFHSIIHNHPFHNGNKRTALLSVCVFLDRCGQWLDQCDDDGMYNFTTAVAAHCIAADRNAEISIIAEWLSNCARKRTKGDLPLTYRELKKILSSFGFSVDPPKGNFLDIHKEGQVVEKIIKQGIHGFRPYHSHYIARLRKRLGLTIAEGVDSDLFYGRAVTEDVLSEFVQMRIEVVRRLAAT